MTTSGVAAFATPTAFSAATTGATLAVFAGTARSTTTAHFLNHGGRHLLQFGFVERTIFVRIEGHRVFHETFCGWRAVRSALSVSAFWSTLTWSTLTASAGTSALPLSATLRSALTGSAETASLTGTTLSAAHLAAAVDFFGCQLAVAVGVQLLERGGCVGNFFGGDRVVAVRINGGNHGVSTAFSLGTAVLSARPAKAGPALTPSAKTWAAFKGAALTGTTATSAGDFPLSGLGSSTQRSTATWRLSEQGCGRQQGRHGEEGKCEFHK